MESQLKLVEPQEADSYIRGLEELDTEKLRKLYISCVSRKTAIELATKGKDYRLEGTMERAAAYHEFITTGIYTPPQEEEDEETED